MLDFTTRSSRPAPTLVVDTSSLFTLTAQLPSELYAGGKKPKHSFGLLDALVASAHRGYHVVIPEMVALEAGEVFSNGASLCRFFPGSPEKAENAPLLRLFLQRIRTIKNMGIIPPLPDDTTGAGNYVKALWKIAGNHTLSPESARHRIIDIRRSQRRPDFGEDAALELMQRQGHHNGNAFLLADDTGALVRAKKMGRKTLTSVDFVQVACENGLLTQAGLTAGWKSIGPALADCADVDSYVKVIASPNFTNQTNRENFTRGLATVAPCAEVAHPAHLREGPRPAEIAAQPAQHHLAEVRT